MINTVRGTLSDQREMRIPTNRLIAFMLITCLIILYTVLFSEPRMGAANNGDYYRFAERVGINGIEVYSDSDFVFFNKVYELWQWKTMDWELLTPEKQSFGNVWLITLIRGLTNLLSDTSITPFSTLYLAVVFSVLLIIAAKILISCSIQCCGSISIWFVMLGIIILMGSMHLAWFNSLYGEALLFVGLLLSCSLTWSLIQFKFSPKKTIMHILALCISNYLFLTAKPQGVLAWPFWVAMLIFLVLYLLKCSSINWNKLYRTICVAIIVVYCIYSGVSCMKLYQWNNEYNEQDTLYSSLMFGALMLADTDEEAEKMLEDMGLSPELVLDKGHHAYMPASELTIPPRSEKATEYIYNKINTFGVLKFYLSHPAYLWKAMEITAQYAKTPATSLLMYVQSNPKEAIDHQARFTLWETIRPYIVPHHFWQYIVAYSFLFIIIIRSCIRNKHNRRHQLMLLLYCVIMLTGIIQYPLPFIGNGYADTNKQLYLFMLCWDITMLVALCWGITTLRNKLQQCIQMGFIKKLIK